ncbi:hypothetical protein [Leisingera aquaemixtae]|uniref:Uncharacterized protein n=1 Tax=Leisingera aquaemixtae TaxID=1396826 RepID=A0A0P1H6D9_9RHOB|nr:hypothetical protein [Leisingera aquaemixtae]CUH98523.1 hypothetical protein PHA8399_00637 [Leisingera aquaemixtae]
MKVLPGDEEWFKTLAIALEVQNGKLFNMLRRHFEDGSGGISTDFPAAGHDREG